MSKEILLVVDAVSNEKGVSKSIIFEALEMALASATEKRQQDEIRARVAIDRETGDYETFRTWEVLEDDEQEVRDRYRKSPGRERILERCEKIFTAFKCQNRRSQFSVAV